MATASAAPRDVEITLTLNKEEALYVLGALLLVNPHPDARFGGDDPVYTALDRALDAASVDSSDVLNMVKVDGVRS